MRIYTGQSDIQTKDNTVVTIGTFDGLHVGHRNIIEKTAATGKEHSAENFVITFEPHPRSVISPGYKAGLLTTWDEKKDLYESFGVENILVIEFTKEFAGTNFRDFVKEYIVDKLGAVHVVIGHDHKFGKNREGDEKNLRELGKEFGFGVTVVSAVKAGGKTVSSTQIREALGNGDVSKAADMLGRNYSFRGKVVKGAERGRLLGFPTANIEPFSIEKIVPRIGVYVVSCNIDGNSYFGLMNIGVRPTFEEEGERTIEVYFMDFQGKLYGRELEVEFLKRLRDERKFSSKEDLIYQINRDKTEALRFLSKLVN